jgi:cytosine/adenosine deaminase-related metal-dependent hydrolase
VVCPPGEHRYRRTRDADTVLADIEDLLRRHETGPDPLIRVRQSALYVTNLSPELGHGLRDLADRYDTPLAVHAGALRNEPEAVRTYFGTTPIRRLAELGLLTDRLTAIHSAFVDDEERKLMVEAGVHISHSPAKYGSSGESTMSETRAIPELMRAGLDVSLSTDGSVFPIGAMPEAMRAAWQQHNELAADPAAVRPTTALAMATRVAARSLRWADEIGSLTPGKQADLVLVPADDWRYMGTPRPLEAFLALGGSADVHTVIVAGRIRVRDGQPVDFDERELCRTYTDALRSFAERSG